MKRYEELKNPLTNEDDVKRVIDAIFALEIKDKSFINKSIKILESFYSIISENMDYAKKYVAQYGYDISVFYDKSMGTDRKFYIKFIHD